MLLAQETGVSLLIAPLSRKAPVTCVCFWSPACWSRGLGVLSGLWTMDVLPFSAEASSCS